MVYETDFYTTRRPYRASPSLSTYTVTCEPSRQVRILPGLGKVHVVHSYDRIIPYIGHKRLTVVTQPPTIVRVRPSTLYREFDRIENKLRPYTYNSYTNDYLNSDSHVRITYIRNPITGSLPVYRHSTLYSRYYDPYFLSRTYYPSYLDYTPSYLHSYYSPLRSYYYSRLNLYPSERWLDLSLYPSWRYNHFARMFDDETRAIRAQINSLSNQVHSHVPRKLRALPLPYHCRFGEAPARWSNDNYVHKMVCSTPSHSAEYTTYWSDPVRRQFSNGRLACVSIVGGKSHPRRKNIYVFNDDPVRSDIQLLSYYINRFREEKKANKPISVRVILPPLRPTRVFSVPRPLEDVHMDSEETMQMKQERAARLAKLNEINPEDLPKIDVKAKLAEEKAKRETTLVGASKKAAQKKREEDAAKQAATDEEMKKQEEISAKKAADEAAAAAEAKKAAEEAAAKQAAEDAAAKKIADEAAKKAAEELKAKEEAARKEREAKEAAAKAAELERLAEEARQAELAKQAEIEKTKKEEEERARVEEEKRQAEAAKAEEERQQLLRLEEIARQAEEEKEAELARQAEELAELARQEAELVEKAKAEEEAEEHQRKDAEAAELAQKEAELAELETKEKELTEQAEQARAEADIAAAEVVPAENEVVIEEVISEPTVEEPESPAPADEVQSEEIAEILSSTEE